MFSMVLSFFSDPKMHGFMCEPWLKVQRMPSFVGGTVKFANQEEVGSEANQNALK